MRWRRFAVLVCCVLVSYLSATGGADAADSYDVYFVAVGSSWYAAAPPHGRSLTRVPGANKSARLVSDILVRNGARFGAVVTSQDGRFISRSDVSIAINRVGSVLRRERPSRPLVVFYFAGHGVSEGIGWNHFSIPGNFVYPVAVGPLNVNSLKGSTLHAGALVDDIEALGVPYVVILDTCYEGQPTSLESAALAPAAQQSLAGVTAVLRAMNEFRQANPVLFSATPGTLVKTVPDPNDPASGIAVAPLSRRIAMIFKNPRASTTVTLASFVRLITDPALDDVTQPAVTHAELNASANGSMVRAGGSAHVERSLGTATRAIPCCATVPRHESAPR